MITHKVYYFSGTGNSLAAARHVAAALGTTDVVSIADCVCREEYAIDADTLVFVYPVYAYHAPLMVRKFLKKAQISARYTAVLITCGTKCGGAFAEAKKLLKKKGGLSYAQAVPAVENFTPLFGGQKPKRVEKRLRLQAAATDGATAAIAARRTHRVRSFRPLSAFVATLFAAFHTAFPRFLFRVNKKTCTGCGLCAKICPAAAVTLENGRPHFSSRCQCCMGCLHLCPQNALTCLRHTRKSPRYRHPAVQPQELVRR
ncbi:MAG: EFR1 family ferrodoxin [Clostridiales bacterium]|jgi:ferredoxin/flavodoxin|nr:EFR1 family ferrodoxin [Clostridiales bacterium]